jgi:hypothetical protein
MNRALGSAVQLVQNAGVIGRVDLLGARRGAKEAGYAVQIFLVGLFGKGSVFGMRIRFAIECGQQVLNGNYTIFSNCLHRETSPTPFKSLRGRKRPRCDAGYIGWMETIPGNLLWTGE